MHNNHENWYEVMRLTCYTRPVDKKQPDGTVVTEKEDAGCDYHFMSEGEDRAKVSEEYCIEYSTVLNSTDETQTEERTVPHAPTNSTFLILNFILI